MTIFKRLLKLGLCDLIFVVALCLVVYPQLDTFANDPGVGWHLQSGALMLESGEVLRDDPFLGTSAPLPWVADQWLGSVSLAWLYGHGDWPLVYAAIVAISVIAFFCILFSACYRFSGSAIASSIAVFLAYKMSTIQIFVRPLAFSFLLFTLLFLYLVTITQRSRQGIFTLGRTALFLPILFALWANLHPYWVLGIVLMCMWFVGALLDSVVFEKFKLPSSFLLRFLVLILFCVGATFLNPYGVDLHRSIAGLGFSEFFTSLLSEWHSLDFKEPVGKMFEFWLFVVCCGYMFSPTLRKKVGFFEFFSFFGFLHFTLGAVRGVPLLVIVSAPLFAYTLTILPEIKWLERFSELKQVFACGRTLERYESHSSRGLLTMFLFLFAILISISTKNGFPFYTGSYGPTEAPLNAIQELKSKVPPGSSITVVNEFNWGGAIALYGFPEVKYLIDDRLTLRSEEYYREWMDVLRGKTEKDSFLYQQEWYLLSPSSVLAKVMRARKGYTSVYHDERAIILRKDLIE